MVRLLDQRALPDRVRILKCNSVEQVARAIETLAVRGAPAIGVAGAWGVALAAWKSKGGDGARVRKSILEAVERLARTRPTARNLFWAMEAMRKKLSELASAAAPEVRAAILEEAERLVGIEEESNRRIGLAGADLVPTEARILTHCNTGPLATGSFGTALGVVIEASRRGKKVEVFADETRPLFQGARLTCWELERHGIPVTLIVDGAAASVMRDRKIDLAIVGADRIAANGDTANKIGTFGVACAAKRLGIPFYVAAPLTTFDVEIRDGREIPIEERSRREVEWVGSRRIAPRKVKVFNPAFDVTPNDLISAIMTDRGVLKAPYVQSIAQAMKDDSGGRVAVA